jgi:hypothetical protein
MCELPCLPFLASYNVNFHKNSIAGFLLLLVYLLLLTFLWLDAPFFCSCRRPCFCWLHFLLLASLPLLGSMLLRSFLLFLSTPLLPIFLLLLVSLVNFVILMLLASLMLLVLELVSTGTGVADVFSFYCCLHNATKIPLMSSFSGNSAALTPISTYMCM